ncbi:MAG: metalloregulator ArsR/SmtB family transcription factor [Pseudomonadales bacterium]|jgi:DNA-binding transcriptional ArsR family regulator|nr:metalloregulator ArsR/SmtB family transcription factor [Pseudomonadales bacterium]
MNLQAPAPPDPELDGLLHALADGTRRAILDRLSEGPANISTLAEPFEVSLPAVSKHVRVLERAGLVKRERVWREQRISLNPDRVAQAADWVARARTLWLGRLDALEAAVRAEVDAEKGRTP